MGANDKTQDPESQRDAGQTEAGQSEAGPTAWQKHRRAQLEWMRAIQAAQIDYQRQIAEANVVYHASLREVTDKSWNRRLTALDGAAQTPDVAGPQTAEMNRDYAQGVNEANRVAQEAYGRAWYQLQDGLQAAYAKYVTAVGDLYAAASAGMGTGAIGGGGMFAAGDEGPPHRQQLFNLVTELPVTEF